MAPMRLIIFTILTTLFAGCVSEDLPGSETVVAAGDKLPYFSVTLADGLQVSRDKLQGRPSVIVFFNTTCEDCRRELPVIDQVGSDLDGLATFLAIAREEDEASIKAYWESEGLTLPYSPQPGRETYSLFATSGIPQIFISDESLTIRAIYGPDDTLSAEKLTKVIEELAVQ